jgi:hypothetical protein
MQADERITELQILYTHDENSTLRQTAVSFTSE